MFRVARLGGFPVADEIPRVPGLVLRVEQVVRRDAVLRALRHVFVDASSDARLREADEEHARAENDRTRRRALGSRETEIARSGRECLWRDDTARPGGREPGGAPRAAAERDALAEELDAIRVATPDVYALIQENMGEFKAFMTEGLDVAEMQSGKGAPLPTAEEVFGYLGGMDQRRTR